MELKLLQRILAVSILSLPILASAQSGSSTSTITETSYSSTGVISAQLEYSWGANCESGYTFFVGSGEIDGVTYSVTTTYGDPMEFSSSSYFGPGTYPVSGTFPGFYGFYGDPNEGMSCTITASSASANVTVAPPILPAASFTFSTPVRSGQASVLGASVGGFYAGPYPTGHVAILYGSQVIATGILQNDTASSTISGVASIPISFKGIPSGTYEVGIIYGGDSNYSSMSATQSVYVAPAVVSSSTTLTASPASTTAGQQITLTAEVESSGGAANPTGTVTFSSGGITLGRVALNSNSIAVITLSSAGMTPGTYPVIAKYSGDAYNLASTSSLAKVTLEAVTTTTLQVTPTNPAPGQSVSLVATVARQQSAGNAAGTVSYSLDGYTFGTATLNAHGVATLVFPTTGIPAGTYSVLATFEGTALDQQSVSAPVTITVQ